jgi:hypothetical protein
MHFKFCIALIVSFMGCCIHATTHKTDDLLAVVMIVWDTKEDVCKALDPYVQAGVRSFVVYNVELPPDDNTLQVVKAYFDQHNIDTYHLMEGPFDESTSTICNYALDRAEAEFPHIPFVLMHHDVREYLHDVPHLLEFCKEEHSNNHLCYLMVKVIPAYDAGYEFQVWASGLIRAHTGTRYDGDEYEYIALDGPLQKAPEDIFFRRHVPFEEGLPAYRKHHLARMLARYERERGSPRATFELAYTYAKYDDLLPAYYYFQIRVEQNGNREETFRAIYHLGNVTAALSVTHTNYTWAEAEAYYFKAHAFAPQWAEPLVKLAEHYISDNASVSDLHRGYAYAKQARELMHPEDTLGFKKDLDEQCQQLLQKATAYLDKLV